MSTSSGVFTIKTASDKEPIIIDLLELKKADIIIRALNHRLRLAIIKLLAEKPKLPVTSIYIKLKLEQSVASQHLAILRRAGIVHAERDGKFIYYSIDAERIVEIQQVSRKLLK